jgi:hypothetical protein
MTHKKILKLLLDDQLNTKLRDFTNTNEFTPSEIIRVIVENAKLDINIKDWESSSKKQSAPKNIEVRISMSDTTLDKIKILCEKNKITRSDILRILLEKADLSKMKFQTYREMLLNRLGKNLAETSPVKYENVCSILDYQTYKKLKDFAAKTKTIQSEIIKTLLEQSDIRIETKSRSTIFKEGCRNPKKSIQTTFTISKKLKEKINKMRIENRTTYSEIIRRLVHNADLESLHFTKTKTNKSKSANNITTAIIEDHSISFAKTSVPTLKQKNKRKKKLEIEADTDTSGKRKIINVTIYNKTSKHLNVFASKNGFTRSDVLKALIEHSNIKINISHSGTHFFEQKAKKMPNTFFVSGKALDKLDQMRIENRAAYSEIIEHLIEEADFKNMKRKENLQDPQ